MDASQHFFVFIDTSQILPVLFRSNSWNSTLTHLHHSPQGVTDDTVQGVPAWAYKDVCYQKRRDFLWKLPSVSVTSGESTVSYERCWLAVGVFFRWDLGKTCEYWRFRRRDLNVFRFAREETTWWNSWHEVWCHKLMTEYLVRFCQTVFLDFIILSVFWCWRGHRNPKHFQTSEMINVWFWCHNYIITMISIILVLYICFLWKLMSKNRLKTLHDAPYDPTCVVKASKISELQSGWDKFLPGGSRIFFSPGTGKNP